MAVARRLSLSAVQPIRHGNGAEPPHQLWEDGASRLQKQPPGPPLQSHLRLYLDLPLYEHTSLTYNNQSCYDSHIQNQYTSPYNLPHLSFK